MAVISFCISKLIHCCVGLSVGNAAYNKQFNIVFNRTSYAAGVDFGSAFLAGPLLDHEAINWQDVVVVVLAITRSLECYS